MRVDLDSLTLVALLRAAKQAAVTSAATLLAQVESASVAQVARVNNGFVVTSTSQAGHSSSFTIPTASALSAEKVLRGYEFLTACVEEAAAALNLNTDDYANNDAIFAAVRATLLGAEDGGDDYRNARRYL